MTLSSYVEHLDDSFTHRDQKQNNFVYNEESTAGLNLLHPLDHQTVSQHADYGMFCHILVKETFSVTLELKLTLEREQNSLFWVSRSFCHFTSLQQT